MKKKRSGWLRFLLLGVCFCVLATGLFVAGVVVYEANRDIPEPVYASPLENFLNEAGGLEGASSSAGAGSGMPNQAIPSPQLAFRNLIPDSENLPGNLAVIRESVNEEFRDLLNDIHWFEQNKREMDFEKSEAHIAEIQKQFSEVYLKVVTGLGLFGDDAEGKGWPRDSVSMAVFSDICKVGCWDLVARAENLARNGRWMEAASLSRMVVDWNAESYYLRRQGGFTGYSQLTRRTLERLFNSLLGKEEPRFLYSIR
jgi:hypothetical protein